MPNIGKCPKCDNFVSNAKIEYVDIDFEFKPRWKGVSFLCPLCNTVLSVSIDPIAIRTDILNKIAEQHPGR